MISRAERSVVIQTNEAQRTEFYRSSDRVSCNIRQERLQNTVQEMERGLTRVGSLISRINLRLDHVKNV